MNLAVRRIFFLFLGFLACQLSIPVWFWLWVMDYGRIFFLYLGFWVCFGILWVLVVWVCGGKAG